MRFKCFVSSVFKAYELRRDFLVYKLEKHLARHHNEADDHGLNHCCSVLQCFRSRIDEDFYQKLQKEGSLENFIFKSVIGFIGGVILTYVCYIFLIFSLNFTLKRATYICVVLGVVLPLGLAFSVKIRCTVFLCIPQLFSKRGRQALLAYAFILALSGPAKNTLHNVEVMSESLACGQEQLKQAEDDLLQCIEAPNAAVKKSLEKLLENLVFAVEEFKNFVNQSYKLCYSVLETLLHAYRWLYGISVLCNEKMLTPAERCMKIVAESVATCKSVMSSSLQLSEEWSRICRSDSLWNICGQLSNYGKICTDYDLPDILPFEHLDKRLKIFKKRIENIFAVKLEFKRSTVKFNKTSTADEEYEGVATEIRRKTDQFLQYFDVMSVIFGIFILVLFVKVIIYRYKFLTEDEYDNRFITSDFIDIDKTRAEFRMETLLPLELREKRKYIKVMSLRLVPSEKTQLFSSFIFLMFATFKIIIHMLTDSFLYWILSNLRRNGRRLLIISRREEDSKVTVTVAGDNIIAALFRNVTKVFKPYNVHKHLDPVPCLPDPVFPDWNRYYQILALVLICWFLALFEPYGLRLRHIVMVTYHPDRARERAIWLYNRILATRTKFAKFARRRLRKNYRYNDFDSSRWTIYLKPNTRNCLLCKMNLDGVERIKCPTPLCIGLYCRPCYSTIKFCSICLDPADYGDLSDISEEKDSSDESCSPSLYHVGYFTTKRKPIVKSKRFVPMTTRAICFSKLPNDSSDEEKGIRLVEMKGRKGETEKKEDLSTGLKNKKFRREFDKVEVKPPGIGQMNETTILTALQNRTFLKATEFALKSEKSTQTIKLSKTEKSKGAVPKIKTHRSKKSKDYRSNSETERKLSPFKTASMKRTKLTKTRSFKLKIKRMDRFPSTDSDTPPENFKNRPRKPRKINLLTSKISHFFTRRPTTPENVTTDEENNPTSTVFLSDEEFQELSKRLSGKFEDKPPVKRKLSQLSYAPDLLSDLPSSKASELCWDSDNVSDSDQT